MAWTLDREELAWAAGIFDGEGHVRAARSGAYTGVGITVVQACTPPIEPNDAPPLLLLRFRDAFGVDARIKYRGPTTEHGKHRWDLRISRREHVQHVLICMWPWLGQVKRAQALTALAGYQQNQPWPKTHCKRGHAFTEENTRVRLRPRGAIRECMTCSRDKSRAYKQRMRAEARAANGVV